MTAHSACPPGRSQARADGAGTRGRPRTAPERTDDDSDGDGDGGDVYLIGLERKQVLERVSVL